MFLATPLGVRSMRSDVLVAPIWGEATPEREGLGVWKEENSRNTIPVRVPPRVEKGVDMAGDV
ncbi:hypothetical protein Hanom_Chr12g01118211 [Helianthus anomalus]